MAGLVAEHHSDERQRLHVSTIVLDREQCIPRRSRFVFDDPERTGRHVDSVIASLLEARP